MGRFHTFTCRLMAKPGATIDSDDFGGATDDADTVFDLSGFFSSAEVRDTINETTKNGVLTLRATAGRFITKKPILTDRDAKLKYLIEIQINQRSTDNPKLFRFEIKNSTKTKMGKGRHVNLVLTAPDIRMDESLDSQILFLTTPRDAFKRRIDNFNDRTQAAGTADNDVVLNASGTNLDALPDDVRLRQDWIPTEPMKATDHLKEIISRISQPTSIGSLNKDYYWEVLPKPNTYDSDGNINADNRRKYDIKAALFGDAPANPVIIKTTSEQIRNVLQESSAVLDNSRFKDILIGKGKKGAHSLPMEFAKNVSDLTHANIAAEYDITTTEANQYRKNDYIKYQNKFYKAKRDTYGAFTTADWIDLISSYANPWMDIDLWKTNMSGRQLAGIGDAAADDFVGCFHDFNIVRRDYSELDEFASVSVKDINSVISSPANNPQHGQRWLISPTPNLSNWASAAIRVASVATGPYTTSHLKNRIAQWNDVQNQWEISRAPGYHEADGDAGVTGTDEIIHKIDTAEMLRWTGTAWTSVWNVGNSPNHAERPSPFIPVESISETEGRLGVADKALKFTFNWNVFDDIDVFKDDTLPAILSIVSPAVGWIVNKLLKNKDSSGNPVENNQLTFLQKNIKLDSNYDDFSTSFFTGYDDDGNPVDDPPSNSDITTAFNIGGTNVLAQKHRAGRRYGWSIKLPWTESASNGIPLSTFDFNNLNHNYRYKNTKGWHNGVNSEDLGAVRGVEFWQRIQHVNANGDNITGLANIPMIHWFRDLYGRVVYHPYTIRVHNSWQKYRIPAGPGSSLQQHDSRIDELTSIFGYVLPFNHFIKERELTGATFDWAFVIEMGSFCTLPYSENFLYVGGQDAWLTIMADWVTQYTIKNPSLYQIGSLAGIVDMEYVITDKVHLYLEDLHFTKDSYVTSDNDAANGPGDNARSALVHLPSQYDYVNMKGILNRQRSRLKFHPEQHVLSSAGNINLHAGKQFLLGDDIINPGESDEDTSQAELAALQVTHTLRSNGYTSTTTGVRKYQVEAETV